MTRSVARISVQDGAPGKGVVIVVAVYNNVGTILDVLLELEGTQLPIIVVDDGSDDGTTDALDAWSDQDRDPPRRVCRLTVNSGKAAAMLAGFHWARELGFTHALTFDADGQHDASRISAFVEVLDREGPDVLVLGSREPLARGYPLRNRIGRLTSNLAIRAQCGVTHGDVPCGMRVYPLARAESVKCLSGRFAWEEEFITRSTWAGSRVASVCIPSVYAPAGDRESHYRFGRDWAEGIAIYLWLLLLAFIPTWKLQACRRHLRSLVWGCSLTGRSMAARTERLFLVWWVGMAMLVALLPLPYTWFLIAAIAWIGIAWHAPAVVIALVIAAYVAGFSGPGVVSVTIALGLVVGLGLLIPKLWERTEHE